MKEKSSTPELRFPEFNELWIQQRLGNHCSKVGSGKTPKGGEKVYQNSGVPFIRSQNVVNNRLLLDEIHISQETHEEMASSAVQSYDVLLNITGGSIGRSCVVPDSFNEGNVNQHVSIIRLKSYNPFFLQSHLSSWKGQKLIYEGQTGSGREGLNFESIKNFRIFFPKVEEQQKIADFLSAVDERIRLLQEKKQKLEQYKKGVMQKLFPKAGQTNPELRFNDENGIAFPDWEENSLGNLGKTYNGLTGKTKEDFGDGKPYVQYMQIFGKSKIDISNFDYVQIDTNDRQNEVRYGDVFFTTSSETPHEIGMASVLLNEVDEVYLNSFCFGYRPNSLEELVPEFSRQFFRSVYFRKEIIKLAQGSTRFNMSKVALMKLKILLPCTQEQRKIAQFLCAIDDSIDQLGNQIDKTQTFKKGLLQKMFV